MKSAWYTLPHLPWREDRSRTDEVGIVGTLSTHQSIGAHLTGLGVPPVPVRKGEVKIPRQLPDLVLPVEQEDSVPGQEACRLVSEVDVSPNVPRPPQEGVSGRVVVDPDEHVVGVDVREHGVLTVLAHLCSRCRGDDVVAADSVFGQVEIRGELLLLSRWHGQEVPADGLSVLSTVRTPVTKPALAAVKPSIVRSTTTCPVVESQGPTLSVINPTVRVLWPIGFIWDLDLRAESTAWHGSARRIVSSPHWTALFSPQTVRVGARARELAQTSPNEAQQNHRHKQGPHDEKSDPLRSYSTDVKSWCHELQLARSNTEHRKEESQPRRHFWLWSRKCNRVSRRLVKVTWTKTKTFACFSSNPPSNQLPNLLPPSLIDPDTSLQSSHYSLSRLGVVLWKKKKQFHTPKHTEIIMSVTCSG